MHSSAAEDCLLLKLAHKMAEPKQYRWKRVTGSPDGLITDHTHQFQRQGGIGCNWFSGVGSENIPRHWYEDD